MKQLIKYSIIIPHKNIPALLQRCLDSIPNREDVQIIIVDDNSDSNKVDFESFPGINDPRVEVIFTKEGKGAGYARNVGLEKACGKWLLFADADDFFNYCIIDIFNEYIDQEADIIFFKNISLDSDLYTISYRDNDWNGYINYYMKFPGKNAETFLRYENTVPWAKMFKTDMIHKNNILFDEVSIFNDITFNYLAGFYAASIQVDPRALYCVTSRNNSISYSIITIEKELEKVYVHGKRYCFFLKHNISNHNKNFLGFILVRPLFIFKTKYAHFYSKAKGILYSLGFTTGKIIKLCIHGLLLYAPRRIIKELNQRLSKK